MFREGLLWDELKEAIQVFKSPDRANLRQLLTEYKVGHPCSPAVQEYRVQGDLCEPSGYWLSPITIYDHGAYVLGETSDCPCVHHLPMEKSEYKRAIYYQASCDL
jgi:hypothetical protein